MILYIYISQPSIPMHTLEAIIDRFERGRAVLRFEDGQELVLSKRQLPSKIREGSVLHFECYLAEDAAKRREDIARYLLTEILHPHEREENPKQESS